MTYRRSVLALLLLSATPAAAQSLFSITATGGGNTPVTVGSSHLIDLVDQAVNTQGQFSGFQGADTTFSLNYGGVANAVTITKNASNTQATLTFGPTGVTRTFNGVDQADLERQIEDYLKKNGAGDIKDFLKAMNAQSLIAVSDGNPNATTARMADFTYMRFGMFGDESKAYTLTAEGTPSDAGPQVHLSVLGKTFEAGDFSGETATLGLDATLNFSRYVGVSVGGFFAYNSVEDADVFHFGLALGVPIRVVLPQGKTGVLWQVTPWVSSAASASVDIGAGGVVTGVGGTSLLAWTPNETWTFAMANQVGFYSGHKLSFDDYEIDPGVSQTILKNGLRATLHLDPRWSLYAGASVTNLLDDAAVSAWLSPEVGLTFSSAAGSGVLIGFTGDFGDDYSAYGVRVLFKLAF